MTSLWTLRTVVSPCLGVATKLPRRKDGTLNRKLSNMADWLISTSPKQIDGITAFDAVVDSATGVWVRLFVPSQVNRGATPSVPDSKTGEMMPVIFYYHGGGFVFMTPDLALYDQFCRSLARRCHAVVISVHYRRAPEHKFPVAYDDCYTALEWLKSEEAIAILPANVDLSRIYLAGDSAGGNIVHHVGIRAAGNDIGPLVLRGLVLIQPFFGGEERTPAELRMKDPPIISLELLDWFWKAYLPSDANRDHPASNVFGPDSRGIISDASIPPVLVIVGGLDPLQDWQMRYAEDMKKAGKKVEVCFYEDGIHLFGHFNQAEIAEQMLIDVVSFLQSHKD